MRMPALRHLDFFFAADFFGGTLAPARRAFDSPMAIACLRLFTFLPDLPLRNVPFLRSCIVCLTFACAFLPYFAMMSLLWDRVGRDETAPARPTFERSADPIVPNNQCIA